jgi:hypothetical protein
MKVYTVQITNKYYYDFSVSTIKCGCFTVLSKALEKAKSLYESLCSEYEDEMEEYEDTTEIEEYPDEGYYSITFGEEENCEVHLVTVDEWEVE